MNGLKILSVFGQHNYGDPTRGQGYEYSNFLPALKRLGHEVFFFESFNRSLYADFSDMNRQFLLAIEHNRPDIIFCVLMGYEIWLETLEMVRRNSRSLLINWATDDSWKYDQFSRFIAPLFDLYATTSPEARFKARKQKLPNVVLTQWAADAERLSPPLPASHCEHQVSFVGTSYGNRPQWITALKDRGVEVTCFGHGWDRGPVSAEEIPGIMRNSVISLNFGDSGLVMNGLIPTKSRQIKARIFEVPGGGGFLVTENAPGIDTWYKPGEEIIVFENLDDLVAKIKFFLSHPEDRDRIAAAGHARTKKEHTYDHRFRSLIEAVVQLSPRAKNSFSLPRTCSFDMSGFQELSSRHRFGYFLKLLRCLLVTPCALIWGTQRGPRAARRILFEVSWRVLGNHTYSVSGLPGRLFYRES